MQSQYKDKYITLCEIMIRKVWYFSRERQDALNRTKVGNGYRCEICGEIFSKLTVHHNNPHAGLRDGASDYLDKMFMSEDELTALCDSCHKNLHTSI